MLYFLMQANVFMLQKSAGGVLLPKSAVKFERYLMGEVSKLRHCILMKFTATIWEFMLKLDHWTFVWASCSCVELFLIVFMLILFHVMRWLIVHFLTWVNRMRWPLSSNAFIFYSLTTLLNVIFSINC